MIEALEPLFPGNPNTLAIEQSVLALVAVCSFLWAYRTARPKSLDRQRRVNKTEDVIGLKSLCNPGRRSSDRCATCPHNEQCVRRIPDMTEAEEARERATAQVIHQVISHPRVVGSVLFVDDNEELRKLAETMLTVAGLRVRVASGVDDLLPIRPDEDVLITDWRLLNGSGGDVIRMYREFKPGFPVIVVSALDHPPRDLPLDVQYIRKPFVPEDLIRMVKSVLGA